ncbi:helix-turn-helix domain-containing protein [Sphingomonas crocodyli]|uniref:Helix-turn-helix domain-containing protein n=1 Tax=Sphingomonas crocodyli TaxID=1979270 RepID=A0A437M7L2_9SPHN|nr:helix-turn-helix domain-containing protein [Sphingomonas crocodyli]RVT93484.1 helix-turn-helix domain-containing protein [Sphingomonas crocodyli]
MTNWPIDWRAVVDEAVRRRKREGLSQRSLGELAGVSAPTINAFEQGEINLRFERIVAILHALGMFVSPGKADAFDTFIYNARRKWEELVAPLPSDDPSRQPLGHSEQAYELNGIKAPGSTPQLRRVLAELPKTSGWSPFWVPTREELRPYIEDGMLECWLGRPDHDRAFPDPAHTDFWRIDRKGQAYLHRGYQEDGMDNLEPGTIFDLTLPIWRTAEVLLHAANLASALGGSGETTVRFHARYSGIEGRDLINWSKPRTRIYIDGRHRARSSQIDLEAYTDVEKIETELAVVIAEILTPLYERFDGYELAPDLIETEIRDMRRQPGFGRRDL